MASSERATLTAETPCQSPRPFQLGHPSTHIITLWSFFVTSILPAGTLPSHSKSLTFVVFHEDDDWVGICDGWLCLWWLAVWGSLWWLAVYVSVPSVSRDDDDVGRLSRSVVSLLIRDWKLERCFQASNICFFYHVRRRVLDEVYREC